MTRRVRRSGVLALAVLAAVAAGCARIGDTEAVDGAPSPPPLDASAGPDAPSGDAAAPGCDETSGLACEVRPCSSVQCFGNACVYTPLADGTSCGGDASSRCCAGACVDISTDEDNCGGCGLACGDAQACESVAQTACDPNPAATSGRCTSCTANSQCPLSPQGARQHCRTAEPYADYCAPFAADECASGQVVVDPELCPQYCRY